MARDRGIEVIVDGAHAFAQFPFKHADLDCDYYGTSLHKWVLAPIGTGMLYVQEIKIAKIWPMMAAPPDHERQHPQVRGDRHASGVAAQRHHRSDNFHDSIGGGAQGGAFPLPPQAMVEPACANLPGVKILNSEDPEQSCAIGFISVDGMDAPQTLGILVVEVSHLDGGDCHAGRIPGPAHHAERLHHARRD